MFTRRGNAFLRSRMISRHRQAFTWVEFLVILAVAVVLVLLALFWVATEAGYRAQQSSTLSNMKQLQLATQQMALDGQSTKDTNIGWPGDIGGTFTNWTAQLLNGSYLSTNDLCKLLSAPGINVTPGKTLSATNTGLLVYAVSKNSLGETVFLTTANFTNTPSGGVVNRFAKPYGNKGFVVFRKAGDGALLRSPQAGDTNAVGGYAPICH